MSGRELMLTAGGLGHAPIASGTFGSVPPPALALAVMLAVWAAGLGATGLHVSVNATLVVLGLVFAHACVRHGAWAESTWGRKDPGQVVADEVAGQSLTLLALPWRAPGTPRWLEANLVLLAAGFLAFRAFDIVKPPPARGLERLSAGVGVLVDDLVAGLYALLAMQAFAWLVLPRIPLPAILT